VFSCFAVPENKLAARQANANLNALIDAYRVHGHRTATINPIDTRTESEIVPELDIARYGLSEAQELASVESLVAFSDADLKTVGDLKKKLTETYCQNVSCEFTFIESECEREWFAENFEKMLEEKAFINNEEKRQLATELLQFQEFDRFMNAKLPSIKRYGGEGSESTVAFFRKLLSSAAKEDINSIVLGMPHRGKLNALVTLFKQRPVKIFRKYKGLPEFGDDAKAMMDIPNHFSECF
jgi:probable 2-oxoglutarate dehydrogenase E1 component DHKTD1